MKCSKNKACKREAAPGRKQCEHHLVLSREYEVAKRARVDRARHLWQMRAWGQRRRAEDPVWREKVNAGYRAYYRTEAG